MVRSKLNKSEHIYEAGPGGLYGLYEKVNDQCHKGQWDLLWIGLKTLSSDNFSRLR